MTRIVHLVVDDKFIDAALRDFEVVAPGRHEVFAFGFQPPWRWLKSTRVTPVDLAGWQRRLAAGDVAGVVLHGLPEHNLPLLRAIRPGPVVAWLGWGYDYYGLLADAFPDGLLLPQTAALAGRLARRPGPEEPSLLTMARPYRKPSEAAKAAMRRVDLFCPVLSNEHRLVRQLHPWFQAGTLRFNYGNAEDDLGAGPGADREPGPNLLLGNSATPTNNHLELFDLVRRRLDLAGRQLLVPLGYGDEHYRDHVIDAGRRIFGRAFVPLTDFVPKDVYLERLSSCGFALMNHLRQQAMGNICISALLGARIFLDRRNPAFDWLQAEGVAVDELERVDLRPLDADVRRRQVASLRQGIGREAQLRRTRELVDALLRGAPAPHRADASMEARA